MPCTPSRRDGFYFQLFNSFLIFKGHPAVTDSEVGPGAGLFQVRRTKLNFAGAQRDYFIIMITEVPVRSYGPIYSS
jgi:hypothetical protein